jgi:hypothetical protein
MPLWPPYPTLYEINTWVWLEELSQKYGKPIDLNSVPSDEWNALATYGFDAIWLMGVWKRSPAGMAIANQNASLLKDFQQALPDFQISDNVGSPYCVQDYTVDDHLGSTQGLVVARRELDQRQMKLVLDFVPNHVAPDHPWVMEHPEYFIQVSAKDAKSDPKSYIEVQGLFFACGRDPYFPAWPDVLQLNAFQPGLREAVFETIAGIAAQCDGIRCDMAMLLLNSVFERTWGQRAIQRPETEYWGEIIPAIKRAHSDFIFIAEAYWDMEWELQQRGFDFCYDKRLYDRLKQETAESVRLHLSADLDYQSKLLRFLENHDEPRAASAFGRDKEKATAIVIATLPGARLFHEGQFEGRKVHLPVFLRRRPAEPVDEELRNFYQKLVAAIESPVFRDGEWQLCERIGWPDNDSFLNLIAWTRAKDGDRYLVIVNLSEKTSQARVQVAWQDVAEKTWRLTDRLSGLSYDRSGSEMSTSGLYVELGAWGHNLFECRPIS